MFDKVLEVLLIKAIRDFLSYFSNPVSEFSLTYHSELIDEVSMGIQHYIQHWGEDITKHELYTSLHVTSWTF